MEKLLAIANLGQSTYGRWLFQRLLSGIIMVVALAIVMAIMISALMIGGLYAAHLALLHYGVEPNAAMMITGALTLLIILIFAVIMLVSIRRLRQTPQMLFKKQSPLASHAIEALKAFTNGLMANNKP